MIRTMTIAAFIACSAGAAAAQDDDWELQEDAAQGLSVAAVRYDAGPAILVQCRSGALSVAMAGVSNGSGRPLTVDASRGDGRRDLQLWRSAGAPGAFLSTTPARDARFMRGGGAFSLRSRPGKGPGLRADFDLPTQSANLDRVLTACGWPLADDRDAVPRVGDEVSLSDPDAERRRPSRGRPRAGDGPRSGSPPPTDQRVTPPAERQFSCLIRDGKLTACRPDHPGFRAAGRGAVQPSDYEGRPVYGVGADADGRVVFLTDALIRVVDYIQMN